MKKGLTLMAAAFLLAACMTPAKKKAKTDAESAVSAASASVLTARHAGGETYAASQLRSAENDLRSAQTKLKASDWQGAARMARMAASTAEAVRDEAVAAKRREKQASSVASPKAGETKKKSKTTK